MKALAAAMLLSWAFASAAQGAPPPPPQWKFEMHGFAGGSLYVQDANLGPSEGQQALYVNNQAAAAPAASAGLATPTAFATPAPKQDRLVFGGDVRQSRFNFSVAGPTVWGGATPKGVLEIDFFNGFGSGNYGDVSLTPRMRLGYGELNWGAHRIQFGQNNDLVFALAPTSLAHIAFPVGYGAGNIGWRRPALWGYHTFGDVKDVKSTKLEFAWEVGRSQWADQGNGGSATVAVTGNGTATTPGTVAPGGNGIGSQIVNPTTGTSCAAGCGDAYGFNLGEASGLPAVEARLTLMFGQTASFFVGGHWQEADRSGVGVGDTTTAAGISSKIDTIAGVAGFKAVGGPVTLAGTGFIGKNLSPLIGNFLQFQPNTVGDVHEIGGWVQAGLNFTKELSIWGFIGVDKPNRADAVAAGFTRLQNVTASGLLQYRDGGYAIGLEWFHFHTTTTVPAALAAATAATGGVDTALDGNQFMLTGLYFF